MFMPSLLPLKGNRGLDSQEKERNDDEGESRRNEGTAFFAPASKYLLSFRKLQSLFLS
jgi:hypothetical protein